MSYRDPERRKAARNAWGLRQHGTICRRCGNVDRYPNGNCRPCGIEAQRRKRVRDPLYSARAQVKKYYGITGAEKEALYARQGGNCAFCRQALPDVWARGCHVEHHHATGKVRGLVHARCNMHIGVLDRVREDESFRQLIEEYFDESHE